MSTSLKAERFVSLAAAPQATSRIMALQTSNSDTDLDALIVGAGFSGVYFLHSLRKLGFKAKIYEAAGGLGGTWYWNRYPGARVDSEFYIYQLSMDDLWKDFNWTELFPGWTELRTYFDYLDKKLDLSRDIRFNTRVMSARFDATTDRWAVTTEHGDVVHPRFLILATGFASKPYFPPYKGLDTFKGFCSHTALWPWQQNVDLKGKRVGVIGTGASGVQVIQETGPEAAHLTVFQRTPNLTLPMGQRKMTVEEQEKMKRDLYPILMNRRNQTYFGFTYDVIYKGFWKISKEERILTFYDLWDRGAFRFWFGAFQEIFLDPKVNDEAYAYWRQRVLERIKDPEMQRKLAPEVPPHPFGTKRCCLEQAYFEVFNQPNVTLVNVNEDPIDEIVPTGVKMKNGKVHELDALVLATGFDAVTGSISQIDIQGTDGVPIGEKWRKGLSTYLGLTTAGYPNMFFTYGPHGPTAFCNGPTCVEIQGGWVVKCLEYMRINGYTRIDATSEAEKKWTQTVDDYYSPALFKYAKSWYNGANIPGKAVQSLNFTGGVPLYTKLCEESAEKGYEGFVLSGLKA